MSELDLGTYRCDECGGEFEKTRSDEEAMVEAVGEFGDVLGDDPALVCEECYQELVHSDKREEGRWYWVRKRGGEWFPAMFSRIAVGGWSNGDTWEDFLGEITSEYYAITPPDEVAS